jgi:hypothetical protein
MIHAGITVMKCTKKEVNAMSKKKSYYDPKRTKEIMEAGQSMGTALTYLGPIVVGALVIIDVYYYFANRGSAHYSQNFMLGMGLITLLVFMAVVIDLLMRINKKKGKR